MGEKLIPDYLRDPNQRRWWFPIVVALAFHVAGCIASILFVAPSLSYHLYGDFDEGALECMLLGGLLTVVFAALVLLAQPRTFQRMPLFLLCIIFGLLGIVAPPLIGLSLGLLLSSH